MLIGDVLRVDVNPKSKGRTLSSSPSA